MTPNFELCQLEMFHCPHYVCQYSPSFLVDLRGIPDTAVARAIVSVVAGGHVTVASAANGPPPQGSLNNDTRHLS